jgi:hypothetical protein
MAIAAAKTGIRKNLIDVFLHRRSRRPNPCVKHGVSKFMPIRLVALVGVLVGGLGTVARAADAYVVAGHDSFAIGQDDVTSEVTYSGRETLAVSHRGSTTRYDARVTYERSDGTASTSAKAEYVADVTPAGDTLDAENDDPDYLTVLNQPFAAELDTATLADLRSLRGTIPFDFPSPVSGTSLHGYLRHVPSGMLGTHRAIGVTFEAAGAMLGELPDRPGLALHGTISMHGTAFYDARTALLLSLETTVTIAGTVSNRADKNPVTITFARRIRSANS